MSGNLYYWVANWSLSRAEAAQLLHDPVVDMVDCTSSALGAVLPHLHPTGLHVIAGYITGSSDIAWTSEDFSKLPKWADVLRIDQSNQNLEEKAVRWAAKDVEPGASSAQTAVDVAGERIRGGEDETIYVDQSGLGLVESLAGRAGLPHGQIVAYQWASPNSNPNTVLPGSSARLGQVNADLSVIKASYLKAETPKPPSTGGGGSTTLPPEENTEWHNWHNQGFNACLDELEAWARKQRRPNTINANP